MRPCWGRPDVPSHRVWPPRVSGSASVSSSDSDEVLLVLLAVCVALDERSHRLNRRLGWVRIELLQRSEPDAIGDLPVAPRERHGVPRLGSQAVRVLCLELLDRWANRFGFFDERRRLRRRRIGLELDGIAGCCSIFSYLLFSSLIFS